MAPYLCIASGAPFMILCLQTPDHNLSLCLFHFHISSDHYHQRNHQKFLVSMNLKILRVEFVFWKEFLLTFWLYFPSICYLKLWTLFNTKLELILVFEKFCLLSGLDEIIELKLSRENFKRLMKEINLIETILILFLLFFFVGF